MSDGAIRLKTVAAGDLPTPPSGRVWLFFDSDNNEHLSTKLDDGSVVDLQNALNYTDEKAQDAVGSILTDTAEIDLNYNDGSNQITAALVATSVVAGLYGSASSVGQFTVDSKGRLTSASNLPIAITSTQVTDFTEAVQDAVGTTFVDTASVDLTYNDSLNQVSADVLPAGVNHNLLLNYEVNRHVDHSAVSVSAGTGLSGGGDLTANRTLSVNEGAVNHNNLLNYVANQHVDHSTVSVATAATSGLSGGGDLTATRNLALNINGLTALPDFQTVKADDEVALFDPTLAAHRKVKVRSLLPKVCDLMNFRDSDFVIETLGGLTSQTTGTGASAQAGIYGLDNAENCKGVVQYDTGTASTGRAGLGTAGSNQLFVQTVDFYRLAFRHAIETLSTPAESFVSYPACFTSNVAATGFGANFVGFTYTDSVNGGRYEFRVYSGGVLQATVDTGILADVNYRIYEITIDGATGTARGFIDGLLVATVSTGVPSGPTQAFGFVSKMEKTVGTSQRNSNLDWYCFEYYRTSSR